MTIAQVRTLTSDKYQYDRAVQNGDGVATDYGLPNPPLRTLTLSVYVDGTLQVAPGQYTVDEELGIVTFAAAPADGAEVVFTYQWSLLSDGDVQTFLDLTASNVLLAAASALDTIASSEALVQKVIKTLDFETDGAKVAESLRAHATALRTQAIEPDAADDPGFEIAEMVVDHFSFRERTWAEMLRSNM